LLHLGPRRGDPFLAVQFSRNRYMPDDGCDSGPLMTGACEGAGSGAGIRFSRAGTCGGGSANSGTELRPKPWPAACAKPPAPPRAKPGVAATTQAAANNIAARRRRMIVFLALLCPY
jgi:hypothetical protein